MKFSLWRRRREEELEEEIQSHLQMVIRDRMERGESAQEAKLAARREFGNVGLIKETTRGMWGFTAIEIFWQDLRYGARMLLKQPSFTLMAILTLALGIGANTAIFSVINGVMLRPLPYRDPHRLVMVLGVRPQSQEFPIMSGDFIDLRNQNQTFEHVAAFQPQPLSLIGAGDPEMLGGLRASANLFALLGVEAKLGRTFLAEEDQPGANRVVILGHGLWQRRFGSDPKIIGQTISLNNEPYTVVGVAPPGFQFPRKGDMSSGWPSPGEINLYIPLALAPEQISRTRTSLAVIARLKPQFGVERAQAEVSGIAEQLRRQYPDSNRDKGMRVVDLHQQVIGRVRPALLVLQGAVGFVLLIACANVANLLLARTAARQKEMAIRAAMGASRGRVVRQLLTESLLLATLGGALALLVSFLSVGLLRQTLPDNLPRADEIGIDGPVFGFMFLISLLAGVLSGLVPALQSSRANLSGPLKKGAHGHGGLSSGRFRNLLMVSEVAMALLLLIGAGLMLRSFIQLMSIDPGISTHNVLTMDIRLPRGKYSLPQQEAFFQQLFERLRALPGAHSAGTVYPLPLSGAEDGIGFSIEGSPTADPSQQRSAGPRCVGGDYFDALQIQVKRGRVFTESDGRDAPPVLVINEAMEREYWPNEDPIGKRISLDSRNGQPVWREIVGVVGDIRHLGLDRGLRPEIYFPFTQFGFPPWTLVVRANGDTRSLVAAIRNGVQAIDKEQPISRIHTLDELLENSVSQRRFNLLLLGIFASAALALAAAGIYGVMSYLVAQRTHEIGVRMALGAQVSDVLKLVVKQGMSLTLTGVLIGLITAIGLTRLIKNLLFGVGATDPLTFISIAMLLIIVTLVACWIPARRATKVDPMIALRCE